ncbi:MAG: ABC transporter permease [Clostridia bacterium]|nr:ABC transporter permease [Clostridia bacterium]MDD3971321.1 ABC transporter permease [Clostridia bacterium]MDD4542385.1 ABC transporter permease [Clostridia bacterium]
MKLGLKIALRFLTSNKGQTILIILGIAIGVSVQIFIGSLIQGLQKGLVDKTIGNSSQITINSNLEDRYITDYNQLIDKISLSDDNITKISPVLDNQAFLSYEDNSQSLLVRGFDMEKADGIYDISNRIVEGKLPAAENEILLGINLKDEYGISIGDEISILTVDRKSIKSTVVGFFDLKVSTLNSNWGITTLKNAQAMFENEEKISSIEMQVNEDSIFITDEIALNVLNTIGSDKYKAVNWKEQNESLLSGLEGQSISSLMIQVFVIISVVISIASILAITVIQKSRQIGILKAMGIRNSTTSYIFLFEGLILGFFGALAGILLGVGLSFAFTKFAINADGTPVVDLYISYSFIILSGFIAVAASILAALMPAIRSSKLNAIDIIRNN